MHVGSRLLSLFSARWQSRRRCASPRRRPEPRIWQGVYSEAQAARGKEVFSSTCIRCHGPDLNGVTGPALKGDRFFQTFGSEPIDRLYLKVRDTMPLNYGDTVTI